MTKNSVIGDVSTAILKQSNRLGKIPLDFLGKISHKIVKTREQILYHWFLLLLALLLSYKSLSNSQWGGK